MRNYEIENEMYRRAVELIETRYPVGWGGAGVVHTSNGNYYTSVSIETANASAVLCIETGAMLEAHKFNEKVTHCMCLVRKDEKSPYQILSPCGICQERLRYWGEDVQVAVTAEEEKIKFVQLKELQPYHWTKAYPAEELEHWNEYVRRTSSSHRGTAHGAVLAFTLLGKGFGYVFVYRRFAFAPATERSVLADGGASPQQVLKKDYSER